MPDGDDLRQRYTDLQQRIEDAKAEFRVDIEQSTPAYEEYGNRVEQLVQKLHTIDERHIEIEDTLLERVHRMSRRKRVSIDSSVTIRDKSVYLYNESIRVGLPTLYENRNAIRPMIKDDHKDDFDAVMDVIKKYVPVEHDTRPVIHRRERSKHYKDYTNMEWVPGFVQMTIMPDIEINGDTWNTITVSTGRDQNVYIGITSQEYLDKQRDMDRHQDPWKQRKPAKYSHPSITPDLALDDRQMEKYTEHAARVYDTKDYLFSAMDRYEKRLDAHLYTLDMIEDELTNILKRHILIEQVNGG